MNLRSFLLSLLIGISCLPSFGQVKDSAYYSRVDARVGAAMEYFVSNVSVDSSILDTVAYIKRIYAYHIEKIQAISNRVENRERMYAYGVDLHNQRLAEVLPEDVMKAYQRSFSENISGFTFCPICKVKYRPGQRNCGFCGELLSDP